MFEPFKAEQQQAMPISPGMVTAESSVNTLPGNLQQLDLPELLQLVSQSVQQISGSSVSAVL